MDERRRSRRVIPEQELTVMVGGNRPARLLDISPDGAQLELATALNPRTECRISLPLPEGAVQLKARVIRCRLTSRSQSGPGGRLVYRAGLEFLGVDPTLAAVITFAYPPSFVRPVRRGRIKVKVNVGNLANGGHGAH